MVRPFRRADAVRVLAAADTAAERAAQRRRLIHALRGELRRSRRATSLAARRAGRRPGVQPHPPRRPASARPRRVRPYAEFTGEAAIGTVRSGHPAGRGAAHRATTPSGPAGRISSWRGAWPRPTSSAQFKYGSVFYGQMDRNWGPVGLPGIGLSNYGYRASRLAFDIGTRTLRARGPGRSLAGQHRQRWADGAPLLLRPSAASAGCRDRLRLGLWETVGVAGRRPRLRRPATATRCQPRYSGQPVRPRRPTATCCSALDAHWRACRPDHARGPARRSTTSAVPEHGGRQPVPQPLGAHRRRLRAHWAARSAGGRSIPRRPAWPSGRSTRSRTSPTPASASAGTSTTWTSSRSRSACRRGTRWLLTPELTLLRQGEGTDQRSLSRDRRARRARSRSSSSAWSSAPGARRSGCAAAQGPLDLARQRRASITSSTRSTRRAGPWTASRDGSRRRWA